MRAAPKVQRAVVQGSVVVVLELIEVLVLDDMVVLLVEDTVLDEELFVVEVLLVDDVVLEPLVLDVTDELVLELVEVVVLDDVLVLVVTVGLLVLVVGRARSRAPQSCGSGAPGTSVSPAPKCLVHLA